ncbi:MAG: DUF6279 family lipoprotein [Methyloversatilis sp.]|uniref:DUF6279 family lipoprotein n=1 Tax=Methyloversatilis sp. TaxID=2569862 RepID=UPI0027350146|nr:DUF6279 family lipoprotein [Methyloversatilis sp.]MDP3871165.1 DUF6279 family lipoprotein [Methyloversatilis sp.]
MNRDAPLARSLKALLPAFAVVLALTGCSFVQMGYNQIDRLIAWRLDDYLPMYSAQRAVVEPAVTRLVDWHCATQLPAYSAWLRTVDADMRAGLSVARANVHIDQALGFGHDIARRAAREVGPLMVGATPAQIETFNKRMKKSNRDYVEDWVEPPRDERVRERARRMKKRSEAWLGKLTPTQLMLIDDWARDVRSNGEDGMESRRRWQTALADVLARRNAERDAVISDLETLFVSPGNLFTPGYSAAFDANRARAAEALSALSASLTPAQRKHLQNEAASLIADIEQIACRRSESSLQAHS